MAFCLAGIDPGLKGAVAFLWPETGFLKVVGMPIIVVTKSVTKKYVDPVGLADLLADHNPAHVFYERVHSMPGEGHVGAFSFGDGFGVIKGVLAGLRIPSSSVEPQVWKKTMRAPANKAQSKARAIELFPDCAKMFTRADLAEAAMIGLYGMMALGHPPIRKFRPLET